MAKTNKKTKYHHSRYRVANNNTGEVVLSAIKKLMKNTAWTARTIVKFIKMEYAVDDPNLSRKVSRALKRGVKLGILQRERGRYRLNAMSRLARPEVDLQRVRQQDKARPRERPLRLRSRTPSKTPVLVKYDRESKIVKQPKFEYHST